MRAVIKVFASLYEKGLIYRDNYMVNWDPGTSSAISDLEVVNREVTDTLYEIDYPVEGSDEVLTVATVRPETMLADTAVAVNPDDERYGSLVGGHVTLPLVGRRLPVIADEHVDVEFGTGALKITPGHDPADFEIGRRHGLEEISVIGEDGRMTAAAGRAVRGPDDDRGERRRGRGAARRGPDPRRAPLRALGPVLGALRRADRAADLAAVVLPHGRAGGARDRGGRARRGPDRPRELQARLPQLDAGDPPVVRLAPALVGPSDPGLVRARRARRWSPRRPSSPARRRAERGIDPDSLRRETDVLDTWFSSALWPFATLGWPEDTPASAGLLPDQLPDHGARDHLPLGRADGDDGDRVRRRDPVPRRLRASGDPGARRAADVEVAGHRDRPAGRDRRPRRRRAALRDAGDQLDPGRPLLARARPAGP